MTSAAPAPPVSQKMLWTGWVLSALPGLALIASGFMKLAQIEPVLKEFDRLGYPPNVVVPLGIIEVGCTILYALPQTSMLGAILLTGYLGGATATHVRLEENWLPPIVMGILLWLGLYLRDPRLRALIPLRKSAI